MILESSAACSCGEGVHFQVKVGIASQQTLDACDCLITLSVQAIDFWMHVQTERFQ